MKRIIFYFILPVFFLCMSACNNKSSKQEEKNTIMTDSVDSNGVQRMQDSKSEQVVNAKGISFHIVLHRIANDTLPRVKTEAGEWFTDNMISLKITRKDGSKVFSKTFTKKNFSSIVPEDFLSHSILEGLVFDKVTDGGLSFAASVCYPQTDLYYPIKIAITSDGSMSMAKEELMEDAYPEGKE